MSEPIVVAIALSDIHLSAIAPSARNDADWYSAMARPWVEIKALANKHSCPILCAGDVFDKWNPPPELINFAIRTLPKMYAIPGQHDLPYHRYSDIQRSAYWTLVECGTLIDLKPGKMEPVSDWFAVMGFPWTHEPKPWVMGEPIQGFNIALVHKYVWTKKTGYPGAPLDGHLFKFRASLKGYRVACVGDNHQGSLTLDGKTTVLNCGGLLRRKTDEKDYKPSVGLIWNNGHVSRHYLDTSEDVLLEKVDLVNALEVDGGFNQYLDTMRALGNSTLDFIEAVQEAMEQRQASSEIRRIVAKHLESQK